MPAGHAREGPQNPGRSTHRCARIKRRLCPAPFALHRPGGTPAHATHLPSSLLAARLVQGLLRQAAVAHHPVRLQDPGLRAQARAVADIRADLVADKRMLRLLQGDVGSGKTVVAALAACVAMDAGWQCALMAPTEILADQHFRKLVAWLEPLGVRSLILVAKPNMLLRGQVTATAR